MNKMSVQTVCSKTIRRLVFEEDEDDDQVVSTTDDVQKINKKDWSFATIIRVLYEYTSFIVLFILFLPQQWMKKEWQLKQELEEKQREWKAQRDEWMAEIERLQDQVYECYLSEKKLIEEWQAKETEWEIQKEKLIEENERLEEDIQRLQKIELENWDLEEKYEQTIKDSQTLKETIEILRQQLYDALNFPVLENASLSKQIDFQGMFDFRREDIDHITRNLVTDLKPHVAMTLLPGLPAYILFMCIRFTDRINDVDKVHALITSFLDSVKNVINRHDDFECAVLWLSNILRLSNNIKQYSGDKTFQIQNTRRQNEQCLRNLDLIEYREILNNVALWIFGNIINQMKERFRSLIVPAILEHEALAGLSVNFNLYDNNNTCQDNLTLILQHLINVHKTLLHHAIDTEVIESIFNNLFYFISASALNNLLQRKELCNWGKGMKIRYNLNILEKFAEETMLRGTIDSLLPIIQATQLLQASKRKDEDVDSICWMCNKLTTNQIIEILNLYTPADQFETRVSDSFIMKVRMKLQERGDKNEQLFMDLKHTIPIRLSFNPSKVRLEDIEIPTILNLPMLRKI